MATKPIDLKPDRTSVLDREIRGLFRDMASGKSANQSRMAVKRMSTERGEIITSRNMKSAPKK